MTFFPWNAGLGKQAADVLVHVITCTTVTYIYYSRKGIYGVYPVCLRRVDGEALVWARWGSPSELVN